MTTTEAIDRLRKCGVEGLPRTGLALYKTSTGYHILEEDAALIAFALGVKWLLRHWPNLLITGDLANIVAAVEAAEGRKNG